ncbi:hypothetical protein NQ314_001389 [Rhamnusium bicolor]|uniref:Uncharacterized protein n=1 Tax=Rhamnusium bicolor TaxID=1586634 RepID=A0AAV8ZRY5_9CUCU|nr:hypothetical protein NQ314_001389 [Rhamnusium bicolor]
MTDSIARYKATYGKTQPTSATHSPGYSHYGGTSSAPATVSNDKRPFNNNLDELDSLLLDLSNSRYANVTAGMENLLSLLILCDMAYFWKSNFD